MERLEKGIVPIVVGGIGNQMFIVAASYVAHKYTKSPLYIFQNTIENNTHNINKYNYNDSIFKYFGTHVPYYQDESVKLNYLDYNLRQPFYAWNPKAIISGTRMCSFFQYYPAIQPFEDELRELFLKGLEEYTNKLGDYSHCAFLHIRRGDYLNNPTYHYIQTLQYYKNGIILLANKSTTLSKIIVVSDDIEWVKSQDFFKLSIFEIYESNNELETLALMAKCKAGAICANSTFSWWGAFLGAYEKRNPVVVPKYWIREKIECLYPTDWFVLE